MNIRREVAAISVAASLGGAMGIAAEANDRAVSGEEYAISKACENTYQPKYNLKVDKLTIKCMEVARIPDTSPVHTYLDTKDPIGLLHGYQDVQKTKSQQFNVAKPLASMVAGAIVGLFLLGKYDQIMTKDPAP